MNESLFWKGKLANFPIYDTTDNNTGDPLGLTAPQVNLLAAQGEYAVKENAELLRSLADDPINSEGSDDETGPLPKLLGSAPAGMMRKPASDPFVEEAAMSPPSSLLGKAAAANDPQARFGACVCPSFFS
mmetsp:Transcript_15267/g.36136  ORF Transcript_15267/g.36136 Transcript_15267/m.36136 type:complete len:130 (+) Transcript_15267:544-933(+)